MAAMCYFFIQQHCAIHSTPVACFVDSILFAGRCATVAANHAIAAPTIVNKIVAQKMVYMATEWLIFVSCVLPFTLINQSEWESRNISDINVSFHLSTVPTEFYPIGGSSPNDVLNFIIKINRTSVSEHLLNLREFVA